MNHLPPLPALRAFESTARLGSVTRAAEELHLTHSAISHQLKALEEFVGVPLLTREGKRIGVTPAGREYAYRVRQALNHITQATQHTAHRGRTDVLKVAILPSFATHWLIPRLKDWYQKHPNIELILDARLDIIDFEHDNADCAIRMGQTLRDSTKQITLMPDWQLMVAGVNDHRYSEAQSVTEAMQMGHLIGVMNSWAIWAEQNNCLLRDTTHELSMNDSNVALAAVEQNMGLLLTRWSIAAHNLQNGRIKQVGKIMVDNDSPYYLVWPDRSTQEMKFQLFHTWLLEQCQDFERFSRARLEFLSP